MKSSLKHCAKQQESTNIKFRIVGALLVSLFVSAPSLAETILFSDHFDNVDGSGAGSAPIAQVGTWSGGGILAKDSGADPGIPPVSSPNHLLMNSGGAPMNFASAANTTQILRTEFDVWVDGGTGGAELDFYTGGTYRFYTQFKNPLGGIDINGTTPGFTIPLEQWTHVTMDYNPIGGAGNLLLTVGANSQAITVPAPFAFDNIVTSTFGGGFGRFDNMRVTLDPAAPVPEPASAILLMIGVIGFSACARRRCR